MSYRLEIVKVKIRSDQAYSVFFLSLFSGKGKKRKKLIPLFPFSLQQCHFCLAWRTSLSTGLPRTTSLFALLKIFFILPSFLKDLFYQYRILNWEFFFLSTLNVVIPLPLLFLMIVLHYVSLFLLPLIALKTFFLSLDSSSLTMMCLGSWLCIYSAWNLLQFVDLVNQYVSPGWRILDHYYFLYLFCPTFSLLAGTPVACLLICLLLSHRFVLCFLSLKHGSFFSFLYLFVLQIGYFLLICLEVHWLFLLLSLIWTFHFRYWTFKFQISIFFFPIASVSLLDFPFVHSL